jgi:phenylalanyl-tRNA synthetase beta chain
MPVITFIYHDLMSLSGTDLTAEEFANLIPMIGADFHHYDASIDEMGVEFFPDRPDMYSVEGIARALRNFVGLEKGLKRYPVVESDIVLEVDDSVEAVRPFVVSGIVRQVRMTDDFIRSLMELQEKIHLTVGRKRQKVAVGIHDLDKVTPPFSYKAVEPDSVSFIPLAKEEMMTLREILQRHEKGVDYAYVLEGKDRFPLITDQNGEVLSFPPIINGNLTTVTEETRNIFIDVTGTDLSTISGVLNIVATMMAERGGRIESVRIQGKESMRTPDLTPTEWDLDMKYANRTLGLDLSGEEMVSCLERMGFDAHVSRNHLKVLVPATRMDILHPVDLVEDVAKGYGYARFGTARPEVFGIGSERPIERSSDLVRQLLVGHGYSEVTTLTLSSRQEQFELMRLQPIECVEILNPITEDHDCMRVSLLPSLLAVLRKSKHRDLPQRIFEVGDVILETRRRRHLAIADIHSKASFTEIKSLADSLLRDMAVSYSFASADVPTYIDGRCAAILVEGKLVGHFGELHPEVIVGAELGYPIAALEIDLMDALGGRMAKVI